MYISTLLSFQYNIIITSSGALLKMKFEGYTMEYDGYPYLVGIKNARYEGYTIWDEGNPYTLV